VPEGIGAGELAAAQQAVSRYVFAAEGQQRAEQQIADARRRLAEAEDTIRQWSGFPEKPPYSMLLVEDLRETDAALRARITALEAGEAYAGREAERFQDEMKRADAALRQAREVAAAAPPDRAPVANWRAEMAQWSARAAAADSLMIQRGIEAMREQTLADKALLKLNEIKLGLAAKDARFTAEDVERVRRSQRERLAQIENERAAALQEAIKASRERDEAAAALAALRTDPAAPRDRLDVAEARLRAAEATVESARFATDIVDSMATAARAVPDMWRLRLEALSADAASARRDALMRLRGMLARVDTGRAYADSQLEIVRSAQREQTQRIARTDPASAAMPYESAVAEALRERAASAQRLRDTVDQLHGSLVRWLAEIDAERSRQPLWKRAADAWAAATTLARSVWNFELFDIEETIDADGQKVTVTRGVTVGKSVGALLVFVLGYWIVSRIMRRIERLLVVRFGVEPAPARTVRRWALALAGFMLIALTLNLARIPLTVFAFLGGALAIGVGFGTQTIIKNFISGLILLAERQVKVGDTVEIDGMTGTVTEVNLRSSTVLGFDGVEAIIPNSNLLEQRVTNWTRSDRKLRRNVDVGVAYGTPVREAADLMKDCASRHGLVLKAPEPFVLFENFGDNALQLSLYFWIEMNPGISSRVIMSDLRFMIEKQFAENGIVVAFPQRDVHLDASRPLPVEIRRAPASPAAGGG
jgi:potassium efflux system protein